MEKEPYNTTILVTLDIHKRLETPATKVQSSACLLGSSFVFIFRSPLGIIVVGYRFLAVLLMMVNEVKVLLTGNNQGGFH